MQPEQPRPSMSYINSPVQEAAAGADYQSFMDHVFHELSQPVSALWCALEVAAMRAPDAEEDRQDLLAAFSVVEELGKKMRSLQDAAEGRLRRPAPGDSKTNLIDH